MQWCQDPMPLTLPLHRRLMATSTSTSITMSTRRLLLPRARPTSTRSTRSTTMLLLPLPTPPTHLTHLTHLTPQRSHLRACTRPTRTRPPIWRVTVDSPSTKSSPQRRYCHHSLTHSPTLEPTTVRAQDYVQDLEGIVNGFLLPLREAEVPDLPILFSNIELLLSVHQNIVKNFEARIGAEVCDSAVDIGDIFIEMVRRLSRVQQERLDHVALTVTVRLRAMAAFLFAGQQSPLLRSILLQLCPRHRRTHQAQQECHLQR